MGRWLIALLLWSVAADVLAVRPELLSREDPITGNICQNWSGSDAMGGWSPPSAAELGIPWDMARSDALWVCASGYMTFSMHFNRLTEAERERIAAFIEQHSVARVLTERDSPATAHYILWLAREIYALRDFDPAERVLIERALLYRGEQLIRRAYGMADAEAEYLEFRDGMNPRAYTAVVFRRAVLLCQAGDRDAADALLATVDADRLLESGLDLDMACRPAGLVTPPHRE